MSKRKSAEVIALNKDEQKKVSKQTKKIKKAIQEGNISVKDKKKELKIKAEQNRGLIYIGHIPHGFYEEEMKEYFKQFGRVTNVKVCRSRTTGNSKGYGYIEFAHPEVAKIAADTMNNYVMFKKRIVTEFVPFEKRPKGLFYGKSSSKDNTSVKTRRGKQKYTKNKVLDDQTVVKKQRKTLKRVQSKLKKLKELGIQCDIKPVGIDNTSLGETLIKKSEDDSDSEVEFKRPDAKKLKSQNGSKTSINRLQSERAVLTKSLDSVKKILSKKSITKTQTEETQTDLPKKKQTRNIKKTIKKEKKPLPLNKETVKRIARELIRKKGNPLLHLVSNKSIKKKS
ncbi:MKI67 FHA domain-interacting nucleolar phosphoprotein-like [Sitophilus oryzae]|uniref:MKI67 FHA domain-interacting nucleolar phosphoprotein-like n=1 Tax=Sitophilus oryzae TaxID=7048 RepID=A0A6J2Y5G0_SITOR|nr:MKI67 FHA domain-interacting nucleolar phosphoprotein-like [Sitophilus oryzae]